jgi:hypothetical protein
MMMANGITNKQSSRPPTSILSKIASLDVKTTAGIYHKCPIASAAKKAAVQRRNRTGDTTSGAKAFPRRSNK